MKIKKRGNFRKLIFNPRAQISIFMVIAIIIMLFGLIYFFYKKQAVENKIDVVRPEISPIKVYVDDCIKSLTDDGLETIGLSGGYASIPQKIRDDPRTYLTTFPAAGFKIPYWWHDGITAMPSEEFIRQQLVSSIDSGLKKCINNFESFSTGFKISQTAEPYVDAQFNENDVSVTLKYPLDIISKNGNVRQTIENFGYTAPVRFKKVYELAKLIMERENDDYFLEKKTIDLYSMDKDIPTTDIEAKCKTRTWQLSTIKEKLKNLLRVNIPYIRIKGSNYNQNIYVPSPDGENVYSQTYYQWHYVWEIDRDANEKYKNMKVGFTYDNYPIRINARPSQNGILKSDSQKGSQMLSFLCLHIWHFTYDVDYPVLVNVLDQETKNNRQYQFNFAFKVSVDHNQPNRLSTGTALFDNEDVLSSDDYCNEVQNEITIFTVNNATGESIPDMNMTFTCGRYSCEIGKSEWISFGAAAGITKRFPFCINGIIEGKKEGFADAKDFIQTDVDGRPYVIVSNPIKEFKNYKVVKHLLANPLQAQELSLNEKASIVIKILNSSSETFVVHPKDGDSSIKLFDGVDLTYDVNIYLTDGEDIIGGYVGELKITKDDLKNANEIVFHVIEQGSATEDERSLFLSGLSSYSKNVPAPEIR